VIGAPRLLFTGSFAATAFEPLYDVSADGQRFAFVVNTNLGQTPFGVLMNWSAHWKARQKN
jgi:hypothetical protein